MAGADLERLADLAYSAAVEDRLWRDWTFELIRQFNSPGALFWVIDSNRFDMCENHMCFLDADDRAVTEEYLAGWVQDDPQMTRVCTARRAEIYLDTDHVDETAPRTAAYLRWQESVVGTRHHITTSVVLDDGLEAGVSLHFSRAQGPVSADVQRQVGSLFPHFARALRLGYRHSAAISENWWDGLSALGEDARILLAPDGKVLRSNEAAETVLARRDGLTCEFARLGCLDPGSEDALSRAIEQACRPRQPAAASVMIRRLGGRAPYMVSVYPLVQRRRFLAPFGATALVCITDPAAHHAGLSQQQTAMLALTPREGELAELLRNGHSLASAAEIMEITYNTCRVHMAALLRKTNTTRQAELLMFLERLG